MAAGVNNLNPFSLDDQNKYGRRAQLLKPKVNTSYFFKMAAKALFLNFLNLTFEYGAIFKLTKAF